MPVSKRVRDLTLLLGFWAVALVTAVTIKVFFFSDGVDISAGLVALYSAFLGIPSVVVALFK